MIHGLPVERDRKRDELQGGKAYSQDLRDRVLAGVDSGLSICQAAKLFRVSISYVSKVVSRRRQTGEI